MSGLDDVLITDELRRRPARPADLEAENRALHALAERMVDKPEAMLEALVRTAVDLCRAGTAGVSLLERGPDGEEQLRWAALAGPLEHHVGSTTPRHWSPCGTCLDRGAPQLYREPARHFGYLAAAEPPIFEGLALPFAAAGEALGTIWIVSHEPDRRFDGEDVRVMTALANFTAAAIRGAAVAQKLQDSEERFRRVVEMAPALVVGMDDAGRLVVFNRACEELTGWSRHDVARQDIPALRVLPVWREVVARRSGRDRIEDLGRPERSPWVTRSGEPRLIEWRCFRAAGLTLGVGNDVTEQVRAEEELRRREDVFRSLSACSPVGIFMADVAGHNTYTNRACLEIFGAAAEAIRGERWADFLHPEDRKAAFRAWYDDAAAGRPYTEEFRLRRPDGAVRWVHCRAAPVLSETGERFGYVGTVEDITERRHAEAMLAAEKRALEMIAGGEPLPAVLDDWLRSLEGVCPGMLASILLLDDAGTHLWPIAGPSLPEAWMRVITPLDVGPSVGSSGAAAYRGETVIVSDVAQDPLWAAFREAALGFGLRACWSTPIIGSQRRPLGTLAMYYREPRVPTAEERRLIDQGARVVQIAIERSRFELERARLVQREQAARAEAERANKAKDEFLAVLSHELRTPLTSIVGWSRVLRAGNRGPAVTATAVETIDRNALALGRLIDDLLDVSRIVTGKLGLTLAPVDLSSVIRNTVESVRPTAEAKGVALDLIGPERSVRVQGDAARLQQIVWNLLANAVKFTPAGGRVEVRLEPGPQHVRLIVTDTGVGIRPEFLPHLFDRFSEDSAATAARGGLGLGLAIVHHLVELHAGRVTAASPGEGRGATFTVTLRRLAGQGTGRPEPPPVGDGETSLRGVRVLLVEDDADSRGLLTSLMEFSGAAVKAVASATEALEVLAAFEPAVLVSDIKLADVDGYALLAEVRRRGHLTPAVAVTAYVGDVDRDRARAAGFNSHIAKPIDPVEFVAALSRLAGR